MKKPRVDRFDPKHIKPEAIDLSGIPLIEEHVVRKPNKKARAAARLPGRQPVAVSSSAEQASQAVIPSPTLKTPALEAKDQQPPRNRVASYHASTLASMQDSTLACYHDSTIEEIRRAVRGAGKEVSFVRLTTEEKRRLAGVVYTYKSAGIRTSENEINRIAVTLLLLDYEQNGERSVLARVIAALSK